MRILLNVLVNSKFWKILCEIILKLGDLISFILQDKESEYNDTEE